MKERFVWKAVHCTAFLLIFGLFSITAEAQISVSPVLVELSDEHTKDVIIVGNQQDMTASYQVEVVAWSQSEQRREIYSPTEDILAVPPLFTVEPGEQQTVRVGMLNDADTSREKSYRIFVTELANPDSESPEVGVNMRLRIGIPVFVAPTAVPRAELNFVDANQMNNQLFMLMRNSGNTRVRVSEIQYRAPGADESSIESAAIYILAGQKGFVPVTLPDERRQGSVTLVTDTLGTLEYELSPKN